MNTGEQPAIDLSEDTKVRTPAKFLWALLVAAAALGAASTGAQIQLKDQDKQLTVHSAAISELQKKDAARDVSDNSTKKDIEFIVQQLGEANKKLDRMLRDRGIRNARGTEE